MCREVPDAFYKCIHKQEDSYQTLEWVPGSSRETAEENGGKVMATRKNFMEKGRRADPMGSNPHSYGLVFSAYTFSQGWPEGF